MKAILFNGPPRCGKDTAGRMLAQMLGQNVAFLKFATPLKMATHAAMAMLLGEEKFSAAEAFESRKDVACDEFLGVSPRQAYIGLSELFVKPMFGPGVFGELLARQVAKLPKETEYVIVTDCGFQEEVEVFSDFFPGNDIVVAQVQRDGANFLNDSRGWVDGIRVGGKTTIVFNNGTLTDLRLQMVYLIQDILEETTLEEEIANGC